MYCAEKVLPPDHFKLFVQGVYGTFEKPKDAINTLVQEKQMKRDNPAMANQGSTAANGQGPLQL